MLYAQLIKNKQNVPRFLILGGAGAGKTTVLKQLSFCMASYAIRTGGINRKIPVLIELGNYSGEKLLDFISEQLVTRGNQGRALVKKLSVLLEHGHVIFLFDAFDEASGEHSQRITQELGEFLNSPIYHHIPVVITSRTQEGHNYLLRELQTFEVQELEDAGLEDFIKLYSSSETSVDDVKEWLYSREMLVQKGIGRNPFWLKLILTGGMIQHEHFDIHEGDSGQFLNKSIDNLLKREWDTKLRAERTWRRVLPRCEQLEETKNALAHLAFTMLCSNGGAVISNEDALNELSQWIISHTGLETLRPQDILGLGYDAQLLVAEFGFVRFGHRLLQESLAAWKIRIGVQLLFQDSEVVRYIENARWWETLILLGEVLCYEDWDTYANLIKLILEARTDERKLILAMGMVQCRLDHNNLYQQVIDTLCQTLRQGATPVFKQASNDLAMVLNGKKMGFLQVLLSCNCEEIQVAVINLLGAIKSSYSIDLLISALRSSIQSEYAIHALGSIGLMATDKLIKALQGESTYVRISIIESLGLIGDSRSVQHLILLFQDDDWKIRAAASAALQQIGEDAIKPLCAALYDQNFATWAAAADALTQMGESAIELLVPNLRATESFRIQVVSAWILWHLGKIAAKPLSAALELYKSYSYMSHENLSMRVLGAMTPVYRRSHKLVWQIWEELSPRASTLVSEVLKKDEWSQIQAKVFAETWREYPYLRRLLVQGIFEAVTARYFIERESNESPPDRVIYDYASANAQILAYDITDFSSKLRSAKNMLNSKTV